MMVLCSGARNRGKCPKWSSCVHAEGKTLRHLVAPSPHPVSLPDQIIYIYNVLHSIYYYNIGVGQNKKRDLLSPPRLSGDSFRIIAMQSTPAMRTDESFVRPFRHTSYYIRAYFTQNVHIFLLKHSRRKYLTTGENGTSLSLLLP